MLLGTHASRRAIALSVVATFATAGVTLVPRAAHAQAQLSEAERKAAARSLFQQGTKEQEAGHYPEAIVLFEKAQKVYDAPTHLQHLAQCQIAIGKLVEAAESYELLKRTQLQPGAPDVFVHAKQQAEADLPALRARIPSLKVELTPKPEQLRGLQLVINDVIIPAELVGVARPVNPGLTKIVARAEGHKDATIDVTLKEKESRSVALALAPGQGTLPPPVVVVGPNPGTEPGVRPEPKHYDPDADKPKNPNGGTRIGLVYVPQIPLNSDNELSFATTQHNIGVEFAFGKSYFRYHLTVAYSTFAIPNVSAYGIRLEPATIGVGIPVHRKDTFRVEVEPTFALLNFNVIGLSGARGGGGAIAAVSSGIDVRVNLVFGHFFLGLSPVGIDLRWAAAAGGDFGIAGGAGAALDYRPRIFVGGEF